MLILCVIIDDNINIHSRFKLKIIIFKDDPQFLGPCPDLQLRIDVINRSRIRSAGNICNSDLYFLSDFNKGNLIN